MGEEGKIITSTYEPRFNERGEEVKVLCGYEFIIHKDGSQSFIYIGDEDSRKKHNLL